MTEHNDVLVSDYLSRVSRATAALPPDQRDELLRDLQEHIDSGRSELSQETEAQVRDILDRLGEPSVIARAAAEDAPYAELSPHALTTYPPARNAAGAGGGAGVPDLLAGARSNSRSHLAVIIAVAVAVVLMALCAGVLFFASSSSEIPVPAPAPAIPS